MVIRTSNRRRFFFADRLPGQKNYKTGDRPVRQKPAKPAKPAETGRNRQKPVIAKNNCRLYYLKRNRQISKIGTDGLAKSSPVACQFSKPINHLNRTGLTGPG